MRKFVCLLTITVAFFIFFTSFVLSEEAKYNFGSAQQTSELVASPGSSISTKIYFYNVFGNRITHVSLKVSEVPLNWEIDLEPASYNATFNVSGILVNLTENLHVEPSETLPEKPETAQAGIEYISSSVGYLPAKPAKVTIRIPKNEQVGKSSNVTVTAVAEWLGQAGTIALKQTRDFKYNVKIVSKGFEEKIVPPTFSKSIRQRLNITEEAVRLGVINNTKLMAALEKALTISLNEKAIENLAKLTEAISRDIDVDRNLDIQEGKSILSTKVKYAGDKSIKSFVVYDILPKSFAESTDKITVNANGKVEVIESDPSYLITYSEMSPGQEVEIKYTVNKAVNSGVLDEMLPPSVYAGSLEEVSTSQALLYLLIGIIVILLIVMAVLLPKKSVRHKKRKVFR